MLPDFSISPVGVGEALSDDADVMALILQCHRHMRAKAGRVVTHVAIDDREGASGRLTGKVADVEKALGRKLSRE
jgi:uncharacterized protein YqgV (UPF0045/DUF77 family)